MTRQLAAAIVAGFGFGFGFGYLMGALRVMAVISRWIERQKEKGWPV